MAAQRINLDYAAGTPLLPEVKAAITAALEEHGNPSSVNEEGQRAKERLEQARAQVANLLNAEPGEVHFTSCGTESNSWALRGLMAANKSKGRLLIVSAVEHPSISLVARRLGLEGASVTTLPVDKEGLVDANDLKAALRPETVLVSVMLANGEVGTVEPIQELSAITHEKGALFHTDAVAAVGHWPVDVKTLGVDALSFAANAFYGPTGAAGLYVRDGIRILPLLEGGGQERGGRSGTEALPAIMGLGATAEIAAQRMYTRLERLSHLRDHLRKGLSSIEGVRFYGARTGRLPHNLHCCAEGVPGESLALGLDQAGLRVGLGSACNAKSMRPSAVLKAMGLSDKQAQGAFVLTLGEPTTEEEIDRALKIIPDVIGKLRRVLELTVRKP